MIITIFVIVCLLAFTGICIYAVMHEKETEETNNDNDEIPLSDKVIEEAEETICEYDGGILMS